MIHANVVASLKGGVWIQPTTNYTVPRLPSCSENEMLSKIKTPLKFFARDFQNHLRNSWNVLTHLEMRARSTFEATVLPIWQGLASIYHIIKNVFRHAEEQPKVNENTPLLEDSREIDSDTESICSQPPVRSGVPVRPLDIQIKPLLSKPVVEEPEILHYTLAPYCVLCRKDFVLQPVDYLDPQMETSYLVHGRHLDWGQVMLAICPATVGATWRYLAVKLDLTQTRENAFCPIGLEKSPPILAKIHFRRRRVANKKDKMIDPDRNYRQEAYAVHRFCRNLAASTFKDQPLHKLICQFGQSTKYLARTHWAAGDWRGSLKCLAPYFATLDRDTDLSSTLIRLMQCPFEIESAISTCIYNRPLSCIINFARTTVPLINSMTAEQSLTQLLFDDSTSHLTAQNTSIYESIMIEHFKLERHAQEGVEVSWFTLAKSISTEGIQGIQIVLGDYGTGVRALRILYEDGTFSSYIGSMFPETMDESITILGRRISGLRIFRDNLKISKIELIAQRSWQVRQSDYLTQIDSPRYPRKKNYMLSKGISTSSLAFSNWRAHDQKSLRKRNFNTWQEGSHVSLLDKANYCMALTVYCLPSSVCGVAFHKDDLSPPTLLGVRNPAAVAIHMELKQGERWRHVLLDLDISEREGHWGDDRCPSFIITTTTSRVLQCTPVVTKSPLQTLPRFSQLTDVQDWTLTGLFTDGTSNPNGSIRNLGVTYHIRSAPPPSTPGSPPLNLFKGNEISLPIPHAGKLPENWQMGFISVVSLQDVTKITVRKRGGRVLGLGIQHPLSTAPEFLGQYDTSFPGEISTIYESEKHGVFLGLRFNYSSEKKIGWGDADSEFVSDVVVETRSEAEDLPLQPNPDVKSFCWRAEGLESKSIAWLFNSTSDCIQHWNGARKAVEVVKVQAKELKLNPGIELPERDYDNGFMLWDEHPYERDEGESASEDEW